MAGKLVLLGLALLLAMGAISSRINAKKQQKEEQEND